MSETAKGFTANVKTPPGLNTIIFTIPGQDSFEVYLPNRLSQGGGFTATIKLLPKDGSNVDAFKNYSLNIDGQRFPLNSGKFEVHLTEWAKESTHLLLVDKDNHLLAGVRLPVSVSQPLPGDSSLPTSATAGGLLQITCPCKGTLGAFDSVKIGGEPMQILASTPGNVVVLNTYDTPGLTVIETNLGGVITKKEFRNLILKLSADKLKLLKGEEATVHIVVGGLEKLKAPAKMTVVATGVVAMGGGNSQTITIDPSAVAADGTYTTAESLFAMSAGTFGVNVTVTVDEKTP